MVSIPFDVNLNKRMRKKAALLQFGLSAIQITDDRIKSEMIVSGMLATYA